MPIFIDTHAHVNFNAYKNDANQVIQRALENDVWMINVGSNFETSKKAVEIAEKFSTRAELGAGLSSYRNEVFSVGYEKEIYPPHQNFGAGVYAAIGLHPLHLETGLVKIKNDSAEIEIQTKEENFDYQKYQELAKSLKVVAIGEIGLDYYYRPKTKKKLEEFKEKQKIALLEQLKLAEELNMPVIFHCRMAHPDLLEILKSKAKSQKSEVKGVIHCFTGDAEQAREYVNMGFYLGFNGLIFKLDFDKIIKETPLEKILLETDCPYLTPPSVGNKRNEPIFIKYIAEKIALNKNVSLEKVIEITSQNAQELFKI